MLFTGQRMHRFQYEETNILETYANTPSHLLLSFASNTCTSVEALTSISTLVTLQLLSVCYRNNDFSMFASELLDHKDLIFQDSTVRLVHIEKDKQNYEKYLGPSFMRAMERMENLDSITASSSQNIYSFMMLIASLLLCLLLH